jgi:hypothetical protein
MTAQGISETPHEQSGSKGLESKDAAEGDDLIDGGAVVNIPGREPHFDPKKHRALTAEKLAKWFTIILAGGLALHYVCFMILSFSGHSVQVEPLGQMFHGWFPALTSIVSAAATYYFTKER